MLTLSLTHAVNNGFLKIFFLTWATVWERNLHLVKAGFVKPTGSQYSSAAPGKLHFTRPYEPAYSWTKVCHLLVGMLGTCLGPVVSLYWHLVIPWHALLYFSSWRMRNFLWMVYPFFKPRPALDASLNICIRILMPLIT